VRETMSRKRAGFGECSEWAQAVLSGRARFILAFCLLTRFAQVAVPGGGGSSGHWPAIALTFALGDLVVWALLRRTMRFYFGLRLALSIVDVGVWSLPSYGAPTDIIVFPSMALAAEAGIRMRLLAGPLVVITNYATIAAADTANDGTVSPGVVVWILFAFGLGLAFAAYEGRMRRHIERGAVQRSAAQCGRARLAGQNAVAMGADSANDRLGTIRPLLGSPVAGSALWTVLDGFKERLRVSTDQVATYLGDIMATWSREHNTHPDLSGDVSIAMLEGEGTVLLTRRQAADLRIALTSRKLSGRVQVQVVGGVRARVPGRALTLAVNNDLVTLDDDLTTRWFPVDPGPLALLLGACWALNGMRESVNAIRAPHAFVAAACFLLAGLFVHRILRREGTSARRQVVVLSFLAGLASAVVLTLGLPGQLTMGGSQNFPAGIPLTVLALLVGLYDRDLGGRSLGLIVLGFGLIVVVGLVLVGPPYRVVDLVTAVVGWPLTGYLPARLVGHNLSQTAERLDAEYRQRDELAVHAAFDDGRHDLIGILDRAVSDASEQLDMVRDRLDPSEVHFARVRIAEVRECLTALRRDVSLSLTTTP